MKKILICFLSLLGMTQALAQEYEYVPFVREGVKWVYYIRNLNYDEYENPSQGDNVVYRTLELKGDTVINGKAYKAMHKYSGGGINEGNDTVPILLREEDKIVYGIVPEGKRYPDCPIYNEFSSVDMYNGEEFVLYDFNDPVAYWEDLVNHEGGYCEYRPDYTDMILVGNRMTKRYVGELFGEFQIIESIGLIGENSYTLGFFMPQSTGMHGTYFGLCQVIENGKVVYEAFENSGDRYLPIVREGVKWINEKVMVNNGDTTSYYYAYHFDGNAPFKNGYQQTFKALRYTQYTSTAMSDTLIAGLRESESVVTCHKNHALNSIIEQDRNMINFYSFQGTGGTLSLYGLATFENREFYAVDYFMEAQREPFLTTENFVKEEPIVIDGVECARCAYIQDGDTLAYVVEGIGFDSRDMGDLLTPFTRRPDPDADYQEWCGLSHVIKDGEIIYKGMRYREGAADGIDEVVADKVSRPTDANYYDLTGRRTGTEVPQSPGIYIHQGKKIVVR